MVEVVAGQLARAGAHPYPGVQPARPAGSSKAATLAAREVGEAGRLGTLPLKAATPAL